MHSLLSESGMKIRHVFLLACAGLVAICALRYIAHRWACRSYERLLAGDNQVQIESLILVAHEMRVVIDEPHLTEYLSNAFRSAVLAEPKFGQIYDVYASLSTGGTVIINVYVPEEE